MGMPKKWEYKIEIIHKEGSEETLEKLGGEGWELIDVVKDLHVELQYLALFKREKMQK